MRTTAIQIRRGLPKAVATGGLAIALVAMSIAPSAARPETFTPQVFQDDLDNESSDVSFRRHFFRGQPGLHAEIDAERRGVSYDQGSEAMSALVDQHAYCSTRYRSYDPATGQYLGYDGQYHFCT